MTDAAQVESYTDAQRKAMAVEALREALTPDSGFLSSRCGSMAVKLRHGEITLSNFAARAILEAIDAPKT